MKSKLKMYIKTSGVIRINSRMVNIQITPHISINQTKKVIGKFKDEVSGIPVNEFIGLGSKSLYLKDTNECGKTAKGIKKNVIKEDIKHENYKDVLFNSKQVYHKMKTLRSQRHQLGSCEMNKISLSCFDDKRYLHNNGIYSYAYGHYEIQYGSFSSFVLRGNKSKNSKCRKAALVPSQSDPILKSKMKKKML